jgi:ketosteroid isomerase-like protein
VSQENVEIVRRMFDAYAQGGIEALLAYFTPDCVFYPDPSWMEEPVYRGRDAFAAFAKTQTEAFGDFVVEIHEIRAEGERVFALTEFVGKAPASGVPIRQKVAHVFSDFHEGMVGEDRTFLSWEEARESVGLEE